MPERTYKITCNECGYSEEVSSAQLPYEEGKTCPRCLKGKMWWVPLAEEARRREVRRRAMPEEERRISILWAIPPILLLAVGGGMALALAVSRAKEVPPTPPPGVANLYGTVTDAETGSRIPGVLISLNGYSAYADSDGDYSFTNLEPGSYIITFQKGGYEIESMDITLVEGNNELNVQMTPIVVLANPPFTFSSVSADMVVCESATAWCTANFSCIISNLEDMTIIHTLTPMYQVYDHYDKEWGEPRVLTRTDYLPTSFTLNPGESYQYSFEGNWYDYEDYRWRCRVLIGVKKTFYFWLRDELGNDSPMASVYRG